jgi:hypothetical protein
MITLRVHDDFMRSLFLPQSRSSLQKNSGHLGKHAEKTDESLRVHSPRLGVSAVDHDFFRCIILKRAVEPQNAQKSQKNQAHVFWERPHRFGDDSGRFNFFSM